MATFASCAIDVLLAGHLHIGHTGNTAARYEIGGHSALVVQAGTATSTRGRGETNSFNVIRIDGPRIVVERYDWRHLEMAFVIGVSEHFEFSSSGWAGQSKEGKMVADRVTP